MSATAKWAGQRSTEPTARGLVYGRTIAAVREGISRARLGHCTPLDCSARHFEGLGYS
jgi:hypothetical protein